jgi:hypothetical protein
MPGRGGGRAIAVARTLGASSNRKLHAILGLMMPCVYKGMLNLQIEFHGSYTQPASAASCF